MNTDRLGVAFSIVASIVGIVGWLGAMYVIIHFTVKYW